MSEKTVHKNTTFHGYKTPHKYPFESSTILDLLRDVSIELYPTGKAWHRIEKGTFQKIHDSIDISFARVLNESKLLLDGIFPDNENFSEKDAELWEYRLGLITNESVDLDLRKAMIRRKFGYPNGIKSRQSHLFIQNQLRLAGFDVYVHENTIPYKTPGEILSLTTGTIQHGGVSQHGNSFQHGGENYKVVANQIDEIESYAVGGDGNLWATFFIGGENLGEIADIPFSRLREFKELIIKMKPAHTVAFIFVNFV